MTKTLRIGTRRSRLATAQATLVVDALRRAHPGLACELAPLLTRGDRRTGPLADAGGKGLFTAELEDALRAGRIHLAVHSAKDMPAEMPAGLVIAAVPDRADPRDALVSRDGLAPADLPRGARVGTGSERRRVQLLALRDDLEIVALRGNVETRLSAALDGALDAVVLAMAGLERVGLAQEHATRVRPLDVATFLPAAGQGALAVQSQADSPAAALAEAIDHRPSHDALLAERAVLIGLGADCHSCVAVHVTRDGDVWRARGLSDATGGRIVRAEASGESAGAAGRNLLDALIALGAARKPR